MSKMVKELILDNDKVVLPGLGCFVAEIVPASFSDKGYTINPPYRKLYFRARPDEGDALVGFYARSNGLEHSVAERIIKDFLSELKSVLHIKKTVVFPGLGRMRATKENNLFFIADEELDIFPEGFGLESISLKTHDETKEEVSAAVADLKSILEESADVVPEPEVYEAVESEVADNIADTVKIYETETVADEPAISEKGRSWKTFLKILLVLFIVFAAIVILYAALGRLFPDLMDRLLYTPAELDILNS